MLADTPLQLRTLAQKILHSSTVSLPAWYDLLKELGLPKRTLPRDVRTRWNSTFRMLDVALQYQKAIERMTGDLDKGFRELELTREEWEIAKHLRDVLKVRAFSFSAARVSLALFGALSHRASCRHLCPSSCC